MSKSTYVLDVEEAVRRISVGKSTYLKVDLMVAMEDVGVTYIL